MEYKVLATVFAAVLHFARGRREDMAIHFSLDLGFAVKLVRGAEDPQHR